MRYNRWSQDIHVRERLRVDGMLHGSNRVTDYG